MKNKEDFITSIRDFIETEHGLYLLRILRSCDLASEETVPKEFGPFYAAFYDLYAPDDSLDLLNYFSGQVDIIENHKHIHLFCEMLCSAIRSLSETLEFVDEQGKKHKFYSVKEAKDKDGISISIPDLIIETLGSKRTIPTVLKEQGVSTTESKSYAEKRHRALEKLYERLYYNVELGMARYFDGDGSTRAYDFTSDECAEIMNGIVDAHHRGKNPLSRRDSRMVINEYFNHTIMDSLQDACNDFYESFMSSAGFMSKDMLMPQHDNCTNENNKIEYKRVLPYKITHVNDDGVVKDICTATKRDYTSKYELRIGGHTIKRSDDPVFVLEEGIAGNFPIQVIGISGENEIFLATNAVQSGLYDSKYTAFMSLLGSGKSSELHSLTAYVFRVRNTIDTLRAINPDIYAQLEAMCDDSSLTYDCLADVYFLVKAI